MRLNGDKDCCFLVLDRNKVPSLKINAKVELSIISKFSFIFCSLDQTSYHHLSLIEPILPKKQETKEIKENRQKEAKTKKINTHTQVGVKQNRDFILPPTLFNHLKLFLKSFFLHFSTIMLINIGDSSTIMLISIGEKQ